MRIRMAEAVKRTNLSAPTLRRLASSRTVDAVRIGNQWRFDMEDLDLFVQTGEAPRLAAREAQAKTAALDYRRQNKAARARG